MRDRKYWNGENERERMVDEVLSSRRRALWLVLTVFLQAVCLVVLAIVFIWGLAALVK
ncbi:MAG: hypothetical protein J6V72_12800 [Kiritimatiellae bacterium]|nr:hypothetical protein [Kiritimatiellia bacterium]